MRISFIWWINILSIGKVKLKIWGNNLEIMAVYRYTKVCRCCGWKYVILISSFGIKYIWSGEGRLSKGSRSKRDRWRVSQRLSICSRNKRISGSVGFFCLYVTVLTGEGRLSKGSLSKRGCWRVSQCLSIYSCSKWTRDRVGFFYCISTLV